MYNNHKKNICSLILHILCNKYVVNRIYYKVNSQHFFQLSNQILIFYKWYQIKNFYSNLVTKYIANEKNIIFW